MMGQDVANGWQDIGTTNLPWAKEPMQDPWTTTPPDLPLFKITCRPDVTPHAYLGRTIFTQDPGRAIITGKCADVGSIVMQQFRGLAARAPYFVNGSAANLREMIDYYDRRYNIRYTEREKVDLENFMASL
jgi:cytochrome c peroxidase